MESFSPGQTIWGGRDRPCSTCFWGLERKIQLQNPLHWRRPPEAYLRGRGPPVHFEEGGKTEVPGNEDPVLGGRGLEMDPGLPGSLHFHSRHPEFKTSG